MKRAALILLLAAAVAQHAWCAAADDLFKQAQTAFSAGKYDDALGLYEQIISQHVEAADRWYSAEKGITMALEKKGDLAGAAQAAHLWMEAAPSVQTYDEAVTAAANLLSAIDKTVDRANQFISFQQTGPVNGAVNPMDAVGYPALPERETALAAMRQQAGDNAAAARLRAFTYILGGKPRDALAQFAEAFRKSSGGADLQRSTSDLLQIGLRDVRGSRNGLDAAMQFMSFGPNGPDGKPNTADDLADPFAEYLPQAPAPDTGGLAGLSADDVAALQKVRAAARLYAADGFVQAAQRRTALGAIARANDALDGWTAELKDWYVQLEKIARISQDWASAYGGLQMASRNRALHFGGVREFWAEIDAQPASKDPQVIQGLEYLRNQFRMVAMSLAKMPPPNPQLHPLKKPAAL